MLNRKSTRLKGYDYSSQGGYFITINVKQRKVNHFGIIVNDMMILNNAGLIVKDEWLKTEKIRQHVALDEFVIMPDHFHAILFLRETQDQLSLKKTGECDSPIQNTLFKSPSKTIGAIVRGFKSACTKRFNVEKIHIEWQRNYYDRIIRNEKEFLNVQNYIINNPANWK